MRIRTIATLAAVLCSLYHTASAQLFWNRAAHFSGTASSYLAVPPDPTLDLTGSYTIEFWIRPERASDGNAETLVERRNGSASEGYTVYLAPDGRIAVRNNNFTYIVSRRPITDGIWTHVAARYDSAAKTTSISINGSLDTVSVATAIDPNPSTDSVTIGTGFNGPFQGDLDNIRIWRGTQTSTELSQYRFTALGTSSGVYGDLMLSVTFEDDDSAGDPFLLFDWSGHTNHPLNRGVTSVDMGGGPFVTQSYNEAARFDGSGDYLAGAHTAAIQPTTALTLEAWVHPLITGTQTILAKGPGITPNFSFLLSGSNNTLRTTINGTFVTASKNIEMGRWTHVAFTYNAADSVYTFYVDGVQVKTGIWPVGAIPANTDSLMIGGGFALAGFNGYLDEVRIAKYVKTPEEIRRYLYQSIENGNEPNSASTNISYNLDGMTTDNCNDGGPSLAFRGDARFTHGGGEFDMPVSPLLRETGVAFPEGFTLKTSNRLIPASGMVGDMVPDTLMVTENVTIRDLNLFLALDHMGEPDLDMALEGPDGTMHMFYQDWLLEYNADGVTTIFDESADSSMAIGVHTTFSPRIRPDGAFAKTFGGKSSQGRWILHVTDDQDFNTGRLTAWGLHFNNATATGVSEIASGLPGTFGLDQNFPNPFNPSTMITFHVPAAATVRLTVFDVLGREVATLVNDDRAAGIHRIAWNAAGLASGVYFYRLDARSANGVFSDVKRMLLVR
jgi:hypothetical protein